MSITASSLPIEGLLPLISNIWNPWMQHHQYKDESSNAATSLRYTTTAAQEQGIYLSARARSCHLSLAGVRIQTAEKNLATQQHNM